MKRILTILLLTTLTLSFMLSCNLDGAGLFLSISEAEETTSTDYSELPVQSILNKVGNDMYLKMGASIKIKDITDDDALWDDVTALNGLVNDAEYDGTNYYIALNDGTDVDLYSIAAIDKDTVLADLTGPLLDDMKITNLFSDGTNTYAVYISGTDIVVTAYPPVGLPDTQIIVATTDSTAKLNSFAIDDGTNTQVFINVYDDSTEENITYHTIFDGAAFNDESNKVDNASFDEYLIGGIENNGYIYLYTNDGKVYRFTAATIDFDEINSATTSIFTDVDETIAIGKNSSDNTIVRSSGVPTVLVTETGGADIIALVAGDEYIFELNLTDAETATITPVEVESEAGNYFNALSSTRITDFYNETGSGDWEFYTATSSSFILATTEEEAVSTVIP